MALAQTGAAPPVGSSLESARSAGVVPAGLAKPPVDPHDLQGVWASFQSGPPPADAVIRPRSTGGALDDDENAPFSSQLCAPDGVFDLGAAGFNLQIIQDGSAVMLVGEAQQDFRAIRLGARHPTRLAYSRNGDSVGHWQASTLIVDTIGLSRQGGTPTRAHVTERITKADGGTTLVDDMVVDEPGHGPRQTRHLTAKFRPDFHLGENVCEEGFAHFQIAHGKLVIDYKAKQ